MNSDHSGNDRAAVRSRTELSRRNFLRGVGVSLALPAFDSLISPSAVGRGYRRGRRTGDHADRAPRCGWRMSTFPMA